MLNEINYAKISIEWNGDKVKKSSIPLKNYIILLLISLGIIFFAFYLRSWYNAAKGYYQNNSIMSEYLSELRINEIDSYILDNPEIVIYYASSKDTNIKSFEKQFKELMEEYEIKDEIVYIDSSNEENSNFISKLNAISDKNLNSILVPNLIFVKDGKINKILYSDKTEINKRDVRNFLIKCEVITND